MIVRGYVACPECRRESYAETQDSRYSESALPVELHRDDKGYICSGTGMIVAPLKIVSA